MEYSTDVKSFLKKNKTNILSKVTICLKDGRKLSGVIMPKGDGDSNVLVLKQDNGYNVGFHIKNIDSMVCGGPTQQTKFSIKTEPKSDGPLISIIGAGGTIASRVEYKTGAVHPMISQKELLNAFPEVSNIAKVNVSQLFSLLSADMVPELWIEIAEEAEKIIKKDKPTGIVITHGTDTMHYTSAALSFMLQDLPCPIILTGAQRSSDRGSSDSKTNLISSIMAAKHDFAEVAVCMHASMNDDVCYAHRGTRVRKMHTSRRDTMRTINDLPLLKIDWRKQKISELSKVLKPKTKLKFNKKLNTNVCMQYYYPGMNPKEISRLSEYEGVVLMGTGLGHVSTNSEHKKSQPLLKEIKELLDSGTAVVMSSQCIHGRVNMNVYTYGRLLREAGVIGHLCDWTPETAYVKLMYVLGNTKKLNKVKEQMETNLVGEISERSDIFEEFESYEI
ncbi:Glu-tRNA(Gln) amidotransferase subunit GatD [Candidatus Micrarchaeota archaeon]|nr:Glu-tRNA(Gln) amidotransferase subunit GatD [Candidatus Micrarchaeota archaeon]